MSTATLATGLSAAGFSVLAGLAVLATASWPAYRFLAAFPPFGVSAPAGDPVSGRAVRAPSSWVFATLPSYQKTWGSCPLRDESPVQLPIGRVAKRQRWQGSPGSAGGGDCAATLRGMTVLS